MTESCRCLISDMQTNSLIYHVIHQNHIFQLQITAQKIKSISYVCLDPSGLLASDWHVSVILNNGKASTALWSWFAVFNRSNMFFWWGEKARRVVKLFKRINLRDFGPDSPLNNKEIGGTHACGWVPVLSCPPLFTTPGCHGSLLDNQKGGKEAVGHQIRIF